MMLWNAVLSFFVAGMGFMLKGKMDELNRLSILLNRTREEVARDHITRKEVDDKVDRIVERFDDGFKRLEAKIDDLSLKSASSLCQKVYNNAEKDLQAKDILKLIEGLDEHERIVFNLFEIEGMHHEEIAKHLMVSERTSKRYLNQARETLKVKITRLFTASKIY